MIYLFGRRGKEQGKFRHFIRIYSWTVIGGLIATLLGLIPLIALKACCNFNFEYVFWIFAAAIVSGAISSFAFSLLSRRIRGPVPFRAKKQVEHYKEIEEDWKRDPELIKIDEKFHPAIFFVFSVGVFGIIANIIMGTLYALSKYGIVIIGYAYIGWVGILTILVCLGGSFWIRQISDVKDFTDERKKSQDEPAK